MKYYETVTISVSDSSNSSLEIYLSAIFLLGLSPKVVNLSTKGSLGIWRSHRHFSKQPAFSWTRAGGLAKAERQDPHVLWYEGHCSGVFRMTGSAEAQSKREEREKRRRWDRRQYVLPSCTRHSSCRSQELRLQYLKHLPIISKLAD